MKLRISLGCAGVKGTQENRETVRTGRLDWLFDMGWALSKQGYRLALGRIRRWFP
ncbi:MAG: hypothetical protein N4J56_006982 [Chroococcidiopsis sp. SAG 2025]|nr:hypothetical protein [Chroococcidiopsis sp. SAG 2025]